MERHDFSSDSIDLIEKYFQYIEREEGGYSEEMILGEYIPSYIRDEIFLQNNIPMVLSCDFFTNCDNYFIRALILSLQKLVVCSGYMILQPDVLSDGMYFVKKGSVDLLLVTVGGKLKLKKKIGITQYFAEGGLFENWKSNPFLARASTDSVLYLLSRVSYESLLREYPRQKELINQRSFSSKRKSVVQEISLNAQEKSSPILPIFLRSDYHYVAIWTILVLMVLLYEIIVIPFRFAFMENHEVNTCWLLFDYMGDTILILDSVFNLYVVGYHDVGCLVSNREKIRRFFVESGKLKLHCFSATPLEIIYFAVPSICPFWKLQTWSLFRLNKLCRAVEIKEKLSYIELYLSRKGVKVPKNTLKVGKLIMLILLAAHLVGCMFFIIANMNQFTSRSNGARHNWANDEGLLSDSPKCPGLPINWESLVERYVASLYWSTATLTTVGYGDVSANLESTPEVVFATFILVIGTAIYTFVIALLEDIVAELDVTSTLYKQKQSQLELYFQMQGLPDTIKAKITKYYENLWRSQKGIAGRKLLNYLPCHLRKDLVSLIAKPLLEQTFFLRECSPCVIYSITDCLKFELFLPDDFLYVAGEVCKSLLLISSGNVDLLTSKEVVFKTISSCAIDEYAFFEGSLYTYTARSSDSCEVFILSFEVSLFPLTCFNLEYKYLSFYFCYTRTLFLFFNKEGFQRAFLTITQYMK